MKLWTFFVLAITASTLRMTCVDRKLQFVAACAAETCFEVSHAAASILLLASFCCQ